MKLHTCVADMFVAMHGASCPFEHHFYALSSRAPCTDTSPVRMGDFEQKVGELLSDVLGALEQKRCFLVERAALDVDVFSAEERDAAPGRVRGDYGRVAG